MALPSVRSCRSAERPSQRQVARRAIVTVEADSPTSQVSRLYRVRRHGRERRKSRERVRRRDLQTSGLPTRDLPYGRRRGHRRNPSQGRHPETTRDTQSRAQFQVYGRSWEPPALLYTLFQPARRSQTCEEISHKGHEVLATKDTKFTKVLRFYFVIFVIFVASLFVPSWPRFSRTSD